MRLHDNTSNYFALRDTTLRYVTLHPLSILLSHSFLSLSLPPSLLPLPLSSLPPCVGTCWGVRVIVFAVFSSVKNHKCWDSISGIWNMLLSTYSQTLKMGKIQGFLW